MIWRTMRQKIRSSWNMWWASTGCVISVDHCMPSSTITSASSLVPTLSRFASTYDARNKHLRNKDDLYILNFAKQKLLNGKSTLGKDRSSSLACLSVRFALEFNMDGTAGDIVRTQVERHMRLCIAATAGRNTLVTLPGPNRFSPKPRMNL